jgi:hypothetical protein
VPQTEETQNQISRWRVLKNKMAKEKEWSKKEEEELNELDYKTYKFRVDIVGSVEYVLGKENKTSFFKLMESLFKILVDQDWVEEKLSQLERNKLHTHPIKMKLKMASDVGGFNSNSTEVINYIFGSKESFSAKTNRSITFLLENMTNNINLTMLTTNPFLAIKEKMIYYKPKYPCSTFLAFTRTYGKAEKTDWVRMITDRPDSGNFRYNQHRIHPTRRRCRPINPN